MKKLPDKEMGSPRGQKKRIGIWLYAGILTLLAVIFFLSPISRPFVREISWNECKDSLLNRKAVERLEIVNNESVNVYLKHGLSSDPGPHYRFRIGSVESFERRLDEAEQHFAEKDKAVVTYTAKTNWPGSLLGWILPLLFLFFVWRVFLRNPGGTGGSSPFHFSDSTATLMEKGSQSPVTFQDVAGLQEAKVEVKEIVDFLKAPEAYTKLGAKIPRGIIIVGPPGTGKTLLAKAVAGEAQVPFFSLSGSEFVEMFVGVGASRVRDLFRKAKEKAPCIVFIDEIDAVGRSRSANAFYTGANDERESTLNQLLTEMDGFSTNSGVIVLAATNRADMLDPALLRPGRFDRHIYLELPNLSEREAIFRVHMKPLLLKDFDGLKDFDDARTLAAQTPGFSGADIANICNESALIAARKKRDAVTRQDFTDAIDRIVAGLEKKSKIITDAEKRIIAHHEAGHAIASWYLKHVDPLVKVSVIPRGKSLGSAWYLPEERQLKTSAEFNDMICASLGGRAAEEIMFGDISSGALDDLEKATRDAYMMVAYFGFDPRLGPISFYDSSGRINGSFQKPYSESTGQLIDEQVRKLIGAAYERTKELLIRHKPQLVALAGLLLRKEMVFKTDLEALLGERGEEKVEEAGRPVAPLNVLGFSHLEPDQ